MWGHPLRPDRPLVLPHFARGKGRPGIQRHELAEGPLEQLIAQAVVVDGHDYFSGMLVRGGRSPRLRVEGAGRVDGAQVGVAPRRGRALVFFPANAAGDFDDRVEHEGAEALDEKWIVRVWVHENEVKKPYGLVDCD